MTRRGLLRGAVAAALLARSAGAVGATAAADGVEALLARLSTEERVGQLLMVSFGGETAAGAAAAVSRLRPGGVVLVRNTSSPAQTRALTAGLQELAAGTPSGVPLLVSIDQEGGEVERLREGIAYFPSKRVLGATRDPALARREGEVEGRELAAMGIQMNLSPVLDLETEPANPIIARYERSMGSDPAAVAELGAAYVAGLQGAGVLACAKHFPGHGDTATDSHVELPVLNLSRRRLDEVELVPFKRVAGTVAAVMPGHLLAPSVDPDRPASLSRAFLTGILRGDLGFGGLILTDDLGAMAGVTAGYGTPGAAVRAVAAGADMVLLVTDLATQQRTSDALLAAVADGTIPAARLEAAARRVLEAKAAAGLLGRTVPPSLDVVGSSEHLAAVRAVCEGAITLVRDPAGDVPLASAGRLMVVSAERLPAAGDGTVFGAEIRRRRPDAVELVFSFSADNAAVRERVLGAVGFDAVVLGALDVGPWQRGLVSALREQGRTVVAVGFGHPADAARLPDSAAFLAAYGARPELVQAAVRALLGEIPARGKLPIPVGDAYPAGWSASTR